MRDILSENFILFQDLKHFFSAESRLRHSETKIGFIFLPEFLSLSRDFANKLCDHPRYFRESDWSHTMNGLSRNALMLAKFHEWRIVAKMGFITDNIIVIFNFIEVTTCNHMMNELNF